MTTNQHVTELTEIIRDVSINNLDKETIWAGAKKKYTQIDDFCSWEDNPQEFRNDFLQQYIRQDILNQGKTQCNTNALVNIYTYMYMLMHIDAFNVAKRNNYDCTFNEIYNNHEEVLLVDFGCGPGTIPLAIAERHSPKNGLNINYLGIDKEPEMLRLAERFFQTSLFRNSLGISISEDIIRVDNRKKPKKIIFVFSYLLSQPGVHTDLKNFITRIQGIMADHSTAEEFYLMYINKDYTGEEYVQDGKTKKAWYEFLNMLRSNHMVSNQLKDYSQRCDYRFRKFNNLDGNDIDQFGCSRPVYVKTFRLFKPQVNGYG